MHRVVFNHEDDVAEVLQRVGGKTTTLTRVFARCARDANA